MCVGICVYVDVCGYGCTCRSICVYVSVGVCEYLCVCRCCVGIGLYVGGYVGI